MNAPIDGTCDDAFAAVREAFVDNFTSRDEHGAAIAVYRRGELVVDLWGGWRDADRSQAWAADTMVCMMSVVKAVTALLVHVLVDRDMIDLDEPVAHYWPGFAANGKGAVRVRHALDHRAGIPAIRRELPRDALFDWDAMTAAIATQPLEWPAGSVPAYHPVTMGFIAGELVKRITGATPGAFLRELAPDIPGFDYYIGVPAAALARCAEVHGDYSGTIFGESDRSSLAYWSIAPVTTNMFNTEAFRRAEIPSINGHGTPRSIAALFGELALCRAGKRNGLISPEAIARAAEEQWHAVEQTSMQERRMGLGFILGGPHPLNANPRAFGHGGAGGALAFADPDLELGFAYGTNHLHGQKTMSPRTRALVDAVMQCAVS
ncbi:MAG: estB 1 [Betaproteobacteria bacterium]|nr:estB 1 [Betaproteobacteria bacterium]MEA3157455.1 hypothetical protein [Betaproteobacteria bacterium]